MFARLCLATLVALFPSVAVAAPIAYEAPARPALLLSDPFLAMLPTGRIARPYGKSAFVGTSAYGVALSPDGRYAIVANIGESRNDLRVPLDALLASGSSLSVVDTLSMTVLSQYRADDASFTGGVVALRNPRNAGETFVFAAGAANLVYAFTLERTGTLVARAGRSHIAVPGPTDPVFADQGRAYPRALATSLDGTTVYAANEGAGSVSAIDVATASLRSTRPVGLLPAALAPMRDGLVVCNEGLMRYRVARPPTVVPPLRILDPDERASSLSFVATPGGGDVGASPLGFPSTTLPLDRATDGVRTVGGIHPSAVVITPDGEYAYVALANVDRIATVLLGTVPRVVGGTELRLFDRAPYGSAPTALALSRDGRRLYAALSGLNAVAVIDARDPIRLHRLGLIPTGWEPSALALSADDTTLFVTNAKGAGPRGAVVPASIQRIDVSTLDVAAQTRTALASTRTAIEAKPRPVVPQFGGRLGAIKHVVYVVLERKTYDSVLGDLVDRSGKRRGDGDPSLSTFGEMVTPNLHALARTFGLADALNADSEDSEAARAAMLSGSVTPFTARTLAAHEGRPLGSFGQDPEDAPRAGYIFHALARHRLAFRVYGELVHTSGYDSASGDPKYIDANSVDAEDRIAATTSLGGLYTLDVPAPAVLAGHIDERYPGYNPRIRDERRAREFVVDFDRLAASGRTPSYTYVWLSSSSDGSARGVPPAGERVADGDRALGIIVSHITHMAIWHDTAIFITATPADMRLARDHRSSQRTFAIVVSPYAKRGYLGHRPLSGVGILKTQEQLLGLPPLSLGDLLATDLADFFSAVPSYAPYFSKPVPTQS